MRMWPEIAFEMGVQLAPVWDEIDREIKAALVRAAVRAIFSSVGIKAI